MPKQLINTVGAMIVIAIFAIGVALIATPIFLQALSTQAEVVRVQEDNTAQEASIANLESQSGDLESLQGDLDDLRAEIPTTPQIYTISQVISDAAAKAGVSVTGITPNRPAAFTGGAQAVGTATTDTSDSEAVEGRVQFPVQISVLATDQASIVDFIDELRKGPRLLGEIDAMVSARGGASATINALAFADITSE